MMIGDSIFKQIGQIAVYWSALEADMEVAIIHIQELDPNYALVITSNLGFWSRYNILMTVANQGGLNNVTEEKRLKRLLKRISVAYRNRNGVIHPKWLPTDDPNVAKRLSLRVKGKMKITNEPISATELEKIADEILHIGVEFAAFMNENNLRPEYSSENAD